MKPSFPEPGQIVDLPCSFVPKGKMLSDENLFESESFRQNLLTNISGESDAKAW